MSNTTLNDVDIDIIGIVTLFGLTEIYYNVATYEHRLIFKNNKAHFGYLDLCMLSTLTALLKIFKY